VTSIATRRTSTVICAEIFGKRIRTDEDVEYLKDWEGGDKHIDMKDVSLPNIVSCQPNQDMMFLKETHFRSFGLLNIPSDFSFSFVSG
jgi:hypothetical protein